MIETDRLILRRATDGDLPALRLIWTDSEVMADLADVRSEEECDEVIERHHGYWRDHGRGFWAVARKSDGEVIGFCGTKPGGDGTPIEGEVEIGWTLRRPFWGQGYAREAAEASLAWGWANTDAPRIVAVIAKVNVRSRALAERIGMTELPELEFDHPSQAKGDRRRRTTIYAIARPEAP